MGANIHMVIGADDFLVAEAVKAIYGDDTGLEVIDSSNSTAAEAQLSDIGAADSSLMEMPFLYPKKTTWWRNVHFLPRAGATGSSEEVKASLERFAKKLAATNLPDNQIFILSAPQLMASSIFAKSLKGAVTIKDLDAARAKKNSSYAARENEARAIEFAARYSLKFAPDALEAFALTVGDDARSQLNEVEKLRSYIGESRNNITLNDVESIVSSGPGVEPSLWSVTNAVAERDARKALLALRPLEGTNGFDIKITSALERTLRQLVVMKDSIMRGVDYPQGGSPWQLDKLRRQAAKWSLLELRQARHRIAALRENAVTGSENITARIEIEINRACAAERKSK